MESGQVLLQSSVHMLMSKPVSGLSRQRLLSHWEESVQTPPTGTPVAVNEMHSPVSDEQFFVAPQSNPSRQSGKQTLSLAHR
jgi:hypothetical protein